jgi:hypothetical protein
MRAISAENYSALQARRLVARDFLWVVARDRATGDPVPDGMWSDIGSITAAVIDPDTGNPVTRSFTGAATLVSISAIPLVSNLSTQNVTITLSQVSDHVHTLINTYDCRQAAVQIFRGLFDPDTRLLVAPAVPRFVGFVDHIDVKSPSENEEGGVTVTCASHTQELTRSNPDTRSHESQVLRLANDDFFKDASVVGEWELFWGRASGKISTKTFVGTGGSGGKGGGVGGFAG